MTAAERGEEIKSVMLFRREDKIGNLAFEFGVTEKTIRRDITILQCEGLPIAARRGRYKGGVYIESWYRGDMPCFKKMKKRF